MSRNNPYRPFTPNPEQMALAPEVSGNAVNGLGESTFRRPGVVYWATDPETIPHGQMQLWFYKQSQDPVFTEQRQVRQTYLEAPLPPLADAPATRSPGEWTAALDRFVTDGTCEMTGAAAMNPDWAFEGQEVRWKNVIVLGVAHDYAEIAQAPKVEAGREVMRQYTRAAKAAKVVAGWLREQGWDAEPVTGRCRPRSP